MRLILFERTYEKYINQTVGKPVSDEAVKFARSKYIAFNNHIHDVLYSRVEFHLRKI